MPEVLSHFGILAGIFAYKYSELGINDKTLNDWVIKYGRTGKVTQARTGEQKELDEARKRIREPGSENEFLKKAAAFFARSL